VRSGVAAPGPARGGTFKSYCKWRSFTKRRSNRLAKEKYKTQLPREKPPWKRNSNGRMIFKFKLKASGVLDEKPWKNDPPKLFEAAGKRTRGGVIGQSYELPITVSNPLVSPFQAAATLLLLEAADKTYNARASSARICVPPIITEFSGIPPTTAPSMFTPRASDGRSKSRKLLEKTRPDCRHGESKAVMIETRVQ